MCNYRKIFIFLLVFRSSRYASISWHLEYPAGSLLYVNNQGTRSNNNRKPVGAAEMQAVQGVVSTPTGVYIDVHEQGARSNNKEMRSIYVVFTPRYALIRPLPFQDYPFCKR